MQTLVVKACLLLAAHFFPKKVVSCMVEPVRECNQLWLQRFSLFRIVVHGKETMHEGLTCCFSSTTIIQY